MSQLQKNLETLINRTVFAHKAGAVKERTVKAVVFCESKAEVSERMVEAGEFLVDAWESENGEFRITSDKRYYVN